MSAIYKNGIAYGGAASTADLISATDADGGASNVQAQLNKKVDIDKITTSTNIITAGEYVADARSIKTLNDSLANKVNSTELDNYATNARLNGISTFSFNVPADGSIALNVSHNARFMVFGTAPNTGVMFGLICATNSAGSATTVSALYEGTNISHQSSQDKLTISNANTTHSPKCICVMFNNTPTVSV